jgi:tetratricopeptide (TPR) repeat protein
MSPVSQRVCFVVMGFGKKTDYESGRLLDLDATYEAIIKPAAVGAGLRCIRADEIIHSGVIDTEMFDMLLRADLVIADISTGNVNAEYELGVRHALRPSSTIIMKESKGRLYFDLDHVSIFEYDHLLGDDIGVREANRAKHELLELIKQVLRNSSRPNSPVYTYLPNLRQPHLTTEEYETLLDETEAYQKHLSDYLQAGNQAFRDSRHDDAVKAFSAAAEMKPTDPYILQQLALATYKSGKPSKIASLIEALNIVNKLDPRHSNDPETLGITGAIYKRLWLLTRDRPQLDEAIHFYSRGFEIRRDYYNGENLAACYDYRVSTQADQDEAQFDRMSARKTRETIITILFELVESPSFQDRLDKRWIYATLVNCSFALGQVAEGEKYELAFLAEKPAEWEIKTYNDEMWPRKFGQLYK